MKVSLDYNIGSFQYGLQPQLGCFFCPLRFCFVSSFLHISLFGGALHRFYTQRSADSPSEMLLSLLEQMHGDLFQSRYFETLKQDLINTIKCGWIPFGFSKFMILVLSMMTHQYHFFEYLNSTETLTMLLLSLLRHVTTCCHLWLWKSFHGQHWAVMHYSATCHSNVITCFRNK